MRTDNTFPTDLSQAKHLIYALMEPGSDVIRYIARSDSGIAAAFEHWRSKNLIDDYSPKGEWVRSLKNKHPARRYDVKVLAEVDDPADLLAAELYCVAYYRYMGAHLLYGVDPYEPKMGYDPLAEIIAYEQLLEDVKILSKGGEVL